MAELSIKKLNESFVEIDASEDINFNIYSRYSEYVSGYNFNPKYKLKIWDGKHHSYNMRSSILPIGLVKDLLLWARNQGTTFELERI
jgi:hypothetical protein